MMTLKNAVKVCDKATTESRSSMGGGLAVSSSAMKTIDILGNHFL
jgi:hypothetical protein